MSRLADKYLPLIFWIILVVAASWASWAIVSGRESVPVPRNGPANEPVDEIPSAVVDQPVLEEVCADGSVRWTLYLDRIIREEGSVMELAKPRALYHFESGETLEVTGEAGTYDEEEGVLILSGGVTGQARVAQLGFSVDEMTWDSGRGMLTASGDVRIIRDGIEFRGDRLTLDLTGEFARIEVGGTVEITSSRGPLVDLADSE